MSKLDVNKLCVCCPDWANAYSSAFGSTCPKITANPLSQSIDML